MNRVVPDFRRFAGPIYVLVLLMITLPLLDVAADWATFQPGQVAWRFGAVGLLTGASLMPVFGLILALAIARLAEHHAFAAILSWVALLLALVLLAVAGFFSLDGIQLRAQVRPQALSRFDFAIIKTIIALVLASIVLAWSGVASIRWGRQLRRTRPAGGSQPEDAMLVMGREPVGS